MQTGTGGNESGATGPSTTPDLTRQAQATYEQAKQVAADSYAQARQTVTDMSREAQRAATEWTGQARSATEAYVRENPWNAVGIAAGIGFIIGLLLRR